MRRFLVLLSALAAAAVLASGTQAGAPDRTEVIVALEAPGLGRARAESRVLSARAKAGRLDLRSPTSVAYLRALARVQGALERRIERGIPSARVRWRYRIVLNGLAVVLPRDRLPELARIPGVASVYPSLAYRPLLDQSPHLIGADLLWGVPDLSTAGNGLKIGIIDDGIDQRHPFFSPAGYTYPPGFPKGDAAFTTQKVIVARAFAPPTTTWQFARAPFDPVHSEHGTHVAGIAAGNSALAAVPGRGLLSGVAPRAYIGNYKALTTPSENFGLIENSAELVAAVEAAVQDGMDVINMSLGEPEIEPTRNPVIDAVNAAADAGVIPVIAAGNDFDRFGRGSVSSPGSAAKAITAAAVTKSDIVAPFSSSGPTPISLQLKPDVAAPGVSILSSVPARAGGWAQLSGTSMAAPHVAGAAALLRQRHPDWTVAQIKSALVLTGDPVFADTSRVSEAPTTREGGGLINVARANDPLVFAAPPSLSFGLLRVGTSAARSVELTDAGGGAGPWSVAVELQGQAPGVTVAAPAEVTVPGRLDVTAVADPAAAERDVTGFVALRRDTVTRRIPFWLRLEAPRLGRPNAELRRPGLYRGNTRGKPALVTTYRYPDSPAGAGLPAALRGPEHVFRVRITRRVANFGVVVVETGRTVRVLPRVVVAGDENRLTGYAGLPLNINPYLETFGRLEPVAGAIAPAPGAYDIVFDTPSPRQAGPFTFRFWIDDRTPPAARLLTRSTPVNGTLVVAVSDVGAGVDPSSIRATLDGETADATYSVSAGRVTVPLGGSLGPGRHRLVLQVSDYQEAKNMENVAGILPNTRFLRATFTVAG